MFGKIKQDRARFLGKIEQDLARFSKIVQDHDLKDETILNALPTKGKFTPKSKPPNRNPQNK